MNRSRLVLTIIFLPAIVPTVAAALAIILFVLAIAFVFKTSIIWIDRALESLSWLIEWLTSRKR